MERRKSNGPIVVGVPRAATLRRPHRVHWSPEDKWYNLRDCKEEKGVDFLRLSRLMGTEILSVGITARNIIVRSLCMFWAGVSMYACL